MRRYELLRYFNEHPIDPDLVVTTRHWVKWTALFAEHLFWMTYYRYPQSHFLRTQVRRRPPESP